MRNKFVAVRTNHFVCACREGIAIDFDAWRGYIGDSHDADSIRFALRLGDGIVRQSSMSFPLFMADKKGEGKQNSASR